MNKKRNFKSKKKQKSYSKQYTQKKYDHKSIEKKWQKTWTKNKIYITKEDKKKDKYYVLDMFPYPSGEGLHVGHPKGYIATDIVSRMKRMQGYSVLHPMGFDAFGLPAENYALKTKTNPMVSVAKNVNRYKKQLEILGLDYDWSREVNTTHPNFYKWTQWIFLQLFKKGLTYESFEPINWCPSCKTGLANEDIEDGKCERCGSIIEKKPMRQWVLKITDYADRLLNDLDAKDINGKPLLDWPEYIKEAQRNWIGRSEGALISFKVKNQNSKNDVEREIKVFTTRPDTLFGVTYVVLAPENKLIQSLFPDIENKEEVKDYIEKTKRESVIDRTDEKKEKTGVPLKGIFAINPVNNEKVPVWIADYVLADYGTGAVMAVPAHDERDWDFAKKYGLNIKEVVIPERIDKRNPPVSGKQKVERKTVHVVVRNPKTDKVIILKWKKHPWTTFPMGGIEDGEDILSAAKREVLEETGYKNLINGKIIGGQVRAEYFAAHKDQNRVSFTSLVTFDLENEERDALSKEEDAVHEVMWKEFKELNVVNMTHAEMDVWLARLNNGITAYTDDGVLVNSGSFNGKRSNEVMKEITTFANGQWITTYKLRDWVFSRQRYWGEPIPVIHCERCGVVPVPEKDLPVTLPKVKSYEPTGTGESPLAAIEKWVNVKCPKCKGKAKRETNTMPQWAGSSWYYLRYEDPKNSKSLVDKKLDKYWSPVDLYVGGAEHATRHLIYARFWHKFLYDIGVVSTMEPFKKLQSVGLIMGEDGRKMSKRFQNVVNPDSIVETYGADTLRIYEMFMGPFADQIAWNTSSMIGSRRFVERVYKFILHTDHSQNENMDAKKIINKAIKKITSDIGDLKFNTAISTLMICLNDLEKIQNTNIEVKKNYLKLLAPFAPHICDELWHALGEKKSIHLSKWPQYVEGLEGDEEINIVLQINGKTRGSFVAKKDETDEVITNMAVQNNITQKWLAGKKYKKVIVVKNRLVNVIIDNI